METSIELKKITIGFIFCGLLALALTACNSGGSGNNFSGTYVNHAESEFSIADDTLVIAHTDGEHFIIHRKTGFRELNEQGKSGKPQYEREEWPAVYDPKTGILTESRKGRVLSLAQGTLILENSPYRRTN